MNKDGKKKVNEKRNNTDRSITRKSIIVLDRVFSFNLFDLTRQT